MSRRRPGFNALASESQINRETVARILAAVAVLGEGSTRDVSDLADVFGAQQVSIVLHTLAAIGKVSFQRRDVKNRNYPTLIWSLPAQPAAEAADEGTR